MALQVRGDIDLGPNGSLLNARFQNLGTAPSSNLNDGLFYHNTGNHAPYYYDVGAGAFACMDATKLTNAIPLAALIGLSAAIVGTRLDQFAAPTNPVAMNGQRVTGAADPTNAQDLATKNYTDTLAAAIKQGVSTKPPVVVVATSNQALTGLPTVDGVTLTAGQRILLTAQTTASQNGPYTVASGAWARSTWDANNEIEPGAQWLTESGTSYTATVWELTGAGPFTVGTTSLPIVQSNALAQYTASNGVQKSGNNFTGQVVAAGGVLVGASGFYADTTVVARAPYKTTITGDGSTSSFTITHNLGTQSVIPAFINVTTNAGEWIPWTVPTNNTLALNFGAAPANGLVYRVAIAG